MPTNIPSNDVVCFCNKTLSAYSLSGYEKFITAYSHSAKNVENVSVATGESSSTYAVSKSTKTYKMVTNSSRIHNHFKSHGDRHSKSHGNVNPKLKLLNRFSELGLGNDTTLSSTYVTCDQLPRDYVTIGLWNAQSLRLKTQLVSSYMAEKNIDLYFIVETWLSDENTSVIGELLSGGDYRLINKPRLNRIGGGICCLHKANIKVTKIDTTERTTMEVLETLVELKQTKITVVTIYRPGSSVANRYGMNVFFNELTDLLSYYSLYKHEVIFIGDFNIHMNKVSEPNTKKMVDILDLFDLCQHVSGSTHQSGNLLDLVLTNRNLVINSCIVDDMNSDHNNILISLNVTKPKTQRKSLMKRRYKDINITAFRTDVSSHLGAESCPDERLGHLDELIHKFNQLAQVLDKHAPRIKKVVNARKPTPWTKSEIVEEKKNKRRLEKKWRRSKLKNDYELFKDQRNKYNSILNSIRRKQISDMISKNKGNSRDMFKALNYALHRKTASPMPPSDDISTLANEFSKFFDDKILKIRSQLDGANDVTPIDVNGDDDSFRGTPLMKFKAMTEPQIKKILSGMTKSCKLDPIPIWLAKECIDEVIPIMTRIVNLSLSQGLVPSQLKHAVVRPLLKKAGLDPIMKNYRPVSNLSFLSKVLEAAVIMQMEEHFTNNNLHDNNQSAYKKYHSTETLLLKIHNDIITSLDQGKIIMLVMLDLSAAFDTIDHKILTDRLKSKYGINGTALQWFKSYLSNRTQSVLIDDYESQRKKLKFGVPQGSKLGPILFNAYIAPMSKVAELHGVIDHKYADDEQLSMSFKPGSELHETEAVQKMEKCIEDIRAFLKINKLSNNCEKTEFLLAGSKHGLSKTTVTSVDVDQSSIAAADKVKNLGVLFDRTMSMEAQVKNICRKVFINLKNIAQIRNSLSREDTKTAVHALVTPHLDYGNALLHGINKKHMDKLQVAQNSAALF
jgi:hypothetical protein